MLRFLQIYDIFIFLSFFNKYFYITLASIYLRQQHDFHS